MTVLVNARLGLANAGGTAAVPSVYVSTSRFPDEQQKVGVIRQTRRRRQDRLVGRGLLSLVVVGTVACGAPSASAGVSPAGAPSQRSAAASSTATAVDGTTSSPSGSSLNATPSSAIARAELKGTIAFSFDTGIWIAHADGSGRRQLTTDGGFDPSLTPDGGFVVYRRLTGADDGEIWIVPTTGRTPRDLVNDPNYSDWGPAVSPDGQQVAFDSNREVGLAVWLMDISGRHQRIVTRGHGEYPAWSPDGRQLAYAGGSYYDIRIANVDGSNDHAVATTPAYDMGPAWSPDGNWIAYHTQADSWPAVTEPGMGSEMEIHLVHPDGTDDHRITDDNVEDSFPVWSPDGRFIMWSRHGELVVTRADGSGMIMVGHGNFPSWIS